MENEQELCSRHSWSLDDPHKTGRIEGRVRKEEGRGRRGVPQLLSSVFRIQEWGLTHYWIKEPLLKSISLCVPKRVRTVYVIVESPVANTYGLANVLTQKVVLLHSPVLWVRWPDARYGKSIARNNIWDVYRHFLLANRLPSPDNVCLMFKLPRKPKWCEIRGLNRGVDEFQLLGIWRYNNW